MKMQFVILIAGIISCCMADTAYLVTSGNGFAYDAPPPNARTLLNAPLQPDAEQKLAEYVAARIPLAPSDEFPRRGEKYTVTVAASIGRTLPDLPVAYSTTATVAAAAVMRPVKLAAATLKMPTPATVTAAINAASPQPPTTRITSGYHYATPSAMVVLFST